MKKVFQVVRYSDGSFVDEIFATKENAAKWHELLFDVQSTLLTEKVREIESFTAETSKFDTYNCIEVRNGAKFLFELYQNFDNGKWYINRDEENSGAEVLIFSNPENIIDVNSLFWIPCVQDAFVCRECNGRAAVYGEQDSSIYHCQECETNAPFKGEN